MYGVSVSNFRWNSRLQHIRHTTIPGDKIDLVLVQGVIRRVKVKGPNDERECRLPSVRANTQRRMISSQPVHHRTTKNAQGAPSHSIIGSSKISFLRWYQFVCFEDCLVWLSVRRAEALSGLQEKQNITDRQASCREIKKVSSTFSLHLPHYTISTRRHLARIGSELLCNTGYALVWLRRWVPNAWKYLYSITLQYIWDGIHSMYPPL